jgi:biopolymer transport protein ExbD
MRPHTSLDLLCVLSLFLVATQSAGEIGALPVDLPAGPPVDEVVVHLLAHEVSVGRGSHRETIDRTARWRDGLRRELARFGRPGDRRVRIVTHDGVPYRDTIAAIDVAIDEGLDAVTVAGEP